MNAPAVAVDQIWTSRRKSFRVTHVDETWTRLRRCIPETGAFDPKAREFVVETKEFRTVATMMRLFYSGRYVGDQKESP